MPRIDDGHTHHHYRHRRRHLAGGRVEVADLEGKLNAALAHAGFSGAHVAVDVVPHLARHRDTGKLRRFIPA